METNEIQDVTIQEAVEQLGRARRVQTRRLAGIRVLWVGLGLWLALFYLDALVMLKGHHRGLLDASVLGVMLGVGCVTLWQFNRCRSRERMLVRLIEREHPELNNQLINAIDFEDQLKAWVTPGPSAPLMHKGIEQAVQSFDDLEDWEGLRPPSLQRESRILLSVAGAWLLSGVLLAGWFWTEVPRFLMPWADIPPYSPLKLVMEPQGAVVDYGKNLEVKVTARGPLPSDLWLMVAEPNGTVEQVGLFNQEPGTYTQIIENIRTDLVYYARAGRTRSKFYDITLSKIPRIEMVEAHYRYPTYAHLSEKRSLLGDHDRELKGYAGTEVALNISSNRPLRTGVVTVDGRPYVCQAVADDAVQAVFPLQAAGPFRVVVEDMEGHVSTDTYEGRVIVVPDGEPMVAIISPGMQAWAIPTAEIPIVVEAQDDLGVRDIYLFRSLNESDDQRTSLYQTQENQTYVQRALTLDLADLGLRPGDMIDYYATASDTLPAHPQTIASEPYRIQIISEQDYASMKRDEMTAEDLRQKYDVILGELEQMIRTQQQLEQQTRELMQAVESAAPNSAAQAARQSQLEALTRQQQALAQEAQTLARQYEQEANSPAVFDIEKDYKEGLKLLAQHIDRAQGHMKNGAQNLAAGQAGGSDGPATLAQANDEQKEALKALGKQTQEMRDRIQQANQEIEKMMALMADVERFKQVYLAQKHLTRQAKSLREQEADDLETRVRFKELAETEGVLTQELTEVREQLMQHAEPLREDYPRVAGDADKIAAEILERRIPALLADAGEQFHQGRGPSAYAGAVAALEQLEAMIDFAGGTCKGGCQNCEFRLKIQMMLNPGNTLPQMMAGLKPGMGMGMVGAMGRGVSGVGGGQMPIAMFGNETWGKNVQKSSLAGNIKVDHPAGRLGERIHSLAGSVEELTPQDKRELELDVQGSGRMMSEYSHLIEAYFQRMAEDR